MATLLLTGFDIWGREAYNSSWETLAEARIEPRPGWKIHRAKLPVSWRYAFPQWRAEMPADTRAIVCFGMSSRKSIDCERIAINLTASELPDADGQLPESEYLVPAAPAAYLSTLPIGSLAADLRKQNIPAGVSHYAGSYICNALFFRVMHFLESERLSIPAGFIHVPHYEAEGGLPREILQAGVSTICASLVDSVAG